MDKHEAYIPDWLYDSTLRNAQTDTLSVKEEEFWIDLIEKYLKPIDQNVEEEVNNFSTIYFSQHFHHYNSY